MSGNEILKSGWRVEDTRAVHRLYNRAVLSLVGDEIPQAVLIRRLRMLGAWCAEMADEMAGISAEDAGMLDVERFWKNRASGARGDGC
jgi:hypothetical protein